MLRSACLACLLLVSACGRKETRHVRSGPMDPPAFWVWHRTSPLTAEESASLQSAGVRHLYWQVAECAWDGNWHVTRIAPPANGTSLLEITPVFRIKPQPSFLGSPDAARLLAETIRRWSDGSPLREMQLDFDCPERLLGNYAKFLKTLGKDLSPTRISITALASWSASPEFETLAESVSSLAPMFYDLEADDPADVKARRFHPMADPAVAERIRSWSKCPRPWFAGLPDFERVSVFGANGKLAGHLRGWTPDAVFFHPDLRPRLLGDGVTVFESAAAADLSGTRIEAGGIAVHRMPDAAVLERLVKTADEAGASGILYFALPGPGIQAAYSPSHLARAPEAPRPVLELEGKGAVLLKNPGPADLPTRCWELEISSEQAGAFQSASPGGFAMAEGPGGVPVELSGTIVLRFSRLSAGRSLGSGPLIRNAAGLRWRIRGLNEKQPLLSADYAR